MSEQAEDRAQTRVTILDEPFVIRSDEEEEYTRRVASHVDTTLRSLRDASPGLEPFPIAVLGAMEITDALFRDRERLGATVDEAVYRIERLAARVDRALETGESERQREEQDRT
ncbi:MAG: cell division protein ZapA [Gemmatimonadota bacterium]|nr:cell division protein ZapA [Gemmatimonadota bacterium]